MIVVGIRFKDSGKTYYFDPRDLDLRQGEHVIVETVRGLEMAKVAHEQRDVQESEIVGELKPVVRRAEAADFERLRVLQARHEEVLARCAEKVKEHSLPMNLVKSEYSFDGSRLTFYFTSEKRVDFRMLVRDLARTFKSRIELRQIGPRDEAKLLGGIGPCGRLLCCATFLPDYARVSIKMAKDQDLPLNPSKISGVCGRLLCCLSYEHEQYIEMRTELPRKGTWVQTPDGPGEVVAVNVLKQDLTVQLASSGMQEHYTMDQVQETTARVGELARNRNDEGITPVARQARVARDRGERRLLRDELESQDVMDALELLEEDSSLDPYSNHGVAAPARGETPPGRHEHGSRRAQEPRRERGPKEPPRQTEAGPASPNEPRRRTNPQSDPRSPSKPFERRPFPIRTAPNDGPQHAPDAGEAAATHEHTPEHAVSDQQAKSRRRRRRSGPKLDKE